MYTPPCGQNNMFNFNSALAEWQQQIARVIRDREVVDELESHLRDEIEQQIRLGESQLRAFETAVQCIGEIETLRLEFAKIEQRKTMYNHNRIYSAALVISAVYFGIGAIGLCNWLRIGGGSIGHLPAWAVPWIAALQVFYTVAIIVTLFLRYFSSDSGRRATRLLNFVLLPAIPAGTVLAIYGLWKVDRERTQIA
jgi:hypothetical protein